MPVEGATRAQVIEHGIIIVATGGDEFKPRGMYTYGEDNRVMTQTEFEKGFTENTLACI